MSNDALEKVFYKNNKISIFIGITLMILFEIIPFSKIPIFKTLNFDIDKITLLLGLLSLVILVIPSIIKIINHKELDIIKKVQEDYGLTDEMVIKEYQTADKAGKLLMANNFTFIKDFFNVKVIPNRDIVWIYEKVTIKQGKKRKEFLIRTIDKKEYKVQMYQDKNIHNCFKNYGYYKHIIIGYDKEIDKLYKKNFNEFLNIQYYKKDTEEPPIG